MAYRARQQRARQLAAEGKTVRQIAGELGSNQKTVKKWIYKRKG
jgi:DNA-binding NarL/FixJ family response regulator